LCRTNTFDDLYLRQLHQPNNKLATFALRLVRQAEGKFSNETGIYLQFGVAKASYAHMGALAPPM
jgi:hypothetical protein